MAGFRERDKRHFPLECAEDVVDLFKDQLENRKEPDLTLLSIVIGAVEACLTINRTVNRSENEDRNCAAAASFPAIQLHTIEALYQRLAVHVKGSVDLTQHSGKYATRELVKKVSDVIWNSLARSYHKDKAHLQSIYSFLTGSKLDCFGVALATVAACQLLGCEDVHLALSEDHAWVVFGKDGAQTMEVTWHGKGLEDKRGLPIAQGLEEKSWLYLNGHPVLCNRYMEVAAIVSAINPAINSTMDSVEMASIQQKMLWHLYDKGHLDKYPQALGNLGELEDNCPTGRSIEAIDLFMQATRSAQQYYDNMHVYPYTYLGSYYYRKGDYMSAIENWSKAASVISQYNHNREDEEIYKEFLEIANEHIPNIVKAGTEQLHRPRLPGVTPLLQDPRCYSLLLQLYDGICRWEEGSSTPVLHAVWAQHLVHTLSKFEEEARVSIMMAGGDGEEEEEEEESQEPKWKLRHESGVIENCERLSQDERPGSTEKEQNLPVKRGRGRPPKKMMRVGDNNNTVKEDNVMQFTEDENIPAVVTNGTAGGGDTGFDTSNDTLLQPDCNEEQIKSAIEELVSRVGGGEAPTTVPNPKLAALAQACGESILNPEFLITGGEPFAMSPSDTEALFKDGIPIPEASSVHDRSTGNKSNEDLLDTDCSNAFPKDPDTDHSEEAQIVPDNPQQMSSSSSPEPDNKPPSPETPKSQQNQVQLSLHSAKMKGLKGILVARKLNANAIKLQLTAQSQVYLRHSVSGNVSVGVTRKRLRRE